MNTIPKIPLAKKVTYLKLGEDIDCVSLFKKVEQLFETCFLFESLGVQDAFSRYSLIGFDPMHVISAKGSTLTIDESVYTVENPYETLRTFMPDKAVGMNYAGGMVGYLSYEALRYIIPGVDVKEHEHFDQFKFGVFTDGVIFDKITGEVFYFYHDTNRFETVIEIIHSSTEKIQGLNITFLQDTLSKIEHKKIVESVKRDILSGRTFQCEVGFKSEYRIEGDTFKIYERLRHINPSPFMYFLKFGDQKIIGASPELLFSLRNGEMTTRPLAGTIRRGSDLAEDTMLSRTLLNDPKEVAEHTMLVDLHRNDMGKVAQFGTVKIRDFMTVKKFSHVQHISSEISGIIKSGDDMFSSLSSNFPMGTVCGTPKRETIKIIDANEPRARGPYGGGVGHFGFNGDCTFALTLRSVFISGTYAYTQTSGGIVHNSVADTEYDEIQRKLEAMRRVLV